MYVTVFLITFIVTYFVHKIYSFRQKIKWADNLPGRKDWFFYNLIFKVQGASPTERARYAIEIVREYPRFCAYFLFPKVCLHVNHPELIKQVLTNPDCIAKTSIYKLSGWGNGLGTAPPDRWRVSRKHINPALGTKSLLTFIPIFDEASQNFVKKLKPNLGKEPFDLFKYSVLVTLDTICATSFGVKVNALEKNISFNEHLEKMHEIIFKRVMFLPLQKDWIFKWTKLYKEDKIAREECYRFGKELVEERKKILAKEREALENSNNNNEIEEAKKDKPVIFLDHLMFTPKSDGTFFPKDEVKDHINTMISAGNETTALAVSHATLFMAIHQHVQDKLVEELKSVFPTRPLDITYEKIQKLTYLDMVIKETLRLCPSVANLARRNMKEIVLDGHRIKPWTDIQISLIGTMRGPEWDPNPNDFDPDRFLPENVAKRHNYAWMAFSIGIRNCIGYKYAMMSLKIMLIHLMTNYKFTTKVKWDEIYPAIDLHGHINVKHMVSIEDRKLYD
ncbi:cytochrome P450 4c21-like [Culicoides brevitarsis]|uniref:cytochrome P450 4c21-like n=1 Tax=Culicoides brevitarsis TaxID=469753 RepID=UPI00307BE127